MEDQRFNFDLGYLCAKKKHNIAYKHKPTIAYTYRPTEQKFTISYTFSYFVKVGLILGLCDF